MTKNYHLTQLPQWGSVAGMDSPIIIYETKAFTKRFDKIMEEKERLELYHFIQSSPKAGDVIIGSGGIRKLRWARPGMGKRGGVRVIYYFFDAQGLISLLTVYAKNEREDLDKQDIKLFKQLVEKIREELED